MTPVQIEMRRRIRVHMLTALAGVVMSFVTFALGAAVAHALGMGESGAAVGAVSLIAIGMIPLFGFWSTYRNLRCPSCNGWVAFQVSQKYSAFGAFARNDCRHCGVEIFAPAATRRFFLVIAVVAILFFLLSLGMAGYMSARNHAASGPAPASSIAP